MLLEESPFFLHQKGRLLELAQTLGRISKKNDQTATEQSFKRQLRIESSPEADLPLKAETNNSIIQEQAFLQELSGMFTDKLTKLKLVGLSLQASSIYLIYYGLTSSVQDLGLRSIQFNGILISLTSLIGIGFVGIYGSVLPRVKSTVVCIMLEILGGIILLALSKSSDSIECKAIQSLVSTF